MEQTPRVQHSLLLDMVLIVRRHKFRRAVNSSAVMVHGFSKKQRVYLSRIGCRIRAERTEQGMSQETLALAADLDRSYVGGVERGERNISALNLKKIADVLHIGVNRLFEE